MYIYIYILYCIKRVKYQRVKNYPCASSRASSSRKGCCSRKGLAQGTRASSRASNSRKRICRMSVCLNVRLQVYMHIRMYVYTYICIYI